MSVLICFALKEEAAPFRKTVAGKPGVSILVVGIGRQNAERSVRQYLADASGVQPEFVITAGFAGGLNPDLQIGDILFESPEPSSFSLQLSTRITAAGAKAANFFCADRIATTVAEKKKLRADTGADVVEMESAAIHSVCREKAIPCVTIRVISDTAGENLPLDFNALAKPDKSLDSVKLFFAIARSPGKISALMRLQQQTNLAATRLAGVLAKVISP